MNVVVYSDFVKKYEMDKNKKWAFVKRALIQFFIGGAVLALIFQSTWERGVAGFIENFVINGTLWTMFTLGNGYFVDILDRKVTWLAAPVKRLLLTILVVFIYTVLSYTIFSLIVMKYKYDHSFISTLRNIRPSHFYYVLLITAAVGTFMHGQSFLKEWRQSVMEAEKLKRANLVSQYEALKNQVNPHFLFNSLNVLSTLVYKDQDMAAEFIRQLSKVYRYVLEVQQKELVPLSVEKSALDAYIYLLQIRFGKNLEVEMELPDSDEILVAPLALQMLVENAIKHNVVSKANPLQIHLKKIADHLVVQNKLLLKNQELPTSGLGLKNIAARYRYLSGKEIVIEQTVDSFEVRLPILTTTIMRKS